MFVPAALPKSGSIYVRVYSPAFAHSLLSSHILAVSWSISTVHSGPRHDFAINVAELPGAGVSEVVCFGNQGHPIEEQKQNPKGGLPTIRSQTRSPKGHPPSG